MQTVAVTVDSSLGFFVDLIDFPVRITSIYPRTKEIKNPVRCYSKSRMETGQTKDCDDKKSEYSF